MQDLNALIATPDVVLTKAVGINNAGWIAALGHDRHDEDGDAHGHDHERPLLILLLVPRGG